MNTYNRLKEIQRNYPDLTFQNKGYQYLSDKVKNDHKEQIKEISELLRDSVEGFVEFNNFKVNKDGSISVRTQCQYGGGIYYIGVCYINIESFK